MIKLSKTSKMPCTSWSLQAIETCPGSADGNGGLVDACKSCYANQGAYLWTPVKNVRNSNKEDWKRDDFVSDFVSALKKVKYHRWFDSGDLYSLELAEKIYQIMVQTPWVSHWIPSRSAKFKKFENVINRMKALPNVSFRFSSDSVMGEYVKGIHGSTIISDNSQITENMFVCGAYTRGGKCGDCRACWDKNVSLVAYPAHGNSVKKVIMLRREQSRLAA